MASLAEILAGAFGGARQGLQPIQEELLSREKEKRKKQTDIELMEKRASLSQNPFAEELSRAKLNQINARTNKIRTQPQPDSGNDFLKTVQVLGSIGKLLPEFSGEATANNTPIQSRGEFATQSIVPLLQELFKKDSNSVDNRIRVKDKASGATGSILESEFDSSLYERL